ncbi:hypothetical protein PR048_030482 [Dryococelus australis]|uniref:UBC core domain-containing protein n=1 Tax=Dryococelus australis TaxID=614101 RepID=A0ABQ9G956_9NEOP|nr:hypothetical protein PR048_030482 [Dryococelus australis]
MTKPSVPPQMSSDKSVSAFPEGENLFKWIGTITGPEGTAGVEPVGKQMARGTELSDFDKGVIVGRHLSGLSSRMIVRKVFEGFVYKLSLEFPHSYPYSAPLVRFVTPCFHPNVDMVGNICLDILKEKWSALYDVRTILLSIQSLLGEPNNDSPLNPTAARLWSNQTDYRRALHIEYERAAKKE